MKRRMVWGTDILAVLALGLTALGWFADRQGWFDPHPFTDVDNIEFEWAEYAGEPALYVSATYTKTTAPCTLIPPIMVFGWAFNERLPMDYTPIRRANEGLQRFSGPQKMRLRLRVETPILDRVEVWARHRCEGRSSAVNTLMIDAEVPERPAF